MHPRGGGVLLRARVSPLGCGGRPVGARIGAEGAGARRRGARERDDSPAHPGLARKAAEIRPRDVRRRRIPGERPAEPRAGERVRAGRRHHATPGRATLLPRRGNRVAGRIRGDEVHAARR